MDFSLSFEQARLQDGARKLMAAKLSSEQIRLAEKSEHGFPTDVWAEGRNLGWPALMISEAHGGDGCSLLDMCVLLEEVGRGGASLPLLYSSGLAATILQNCDRGDKRDAALSAIASGSVVIPALIDEGARNEWDQVSTRIEENHGGYRITGFKVMVPYASYAHEFVVTAIDDAGLLRLVLVDPALEGLTIKPHRSNAGVPTFSVHFSDVDINADKVIGSGDKAAVALGSGLNVGALLATAEAVGMCEAMIALSSDYASVREAFGKPIGAFQAVSHLCSEMRVSTDTVRMLVHSAAWQDDHGASALEEIHSTKAVANELFERLSNDAFRVHGAIGFSNEYKLQSFLRRMQWFMHSLGETTELYERASSALGM